MHSNWRDEQAWKDAGLRMTGSGDEACKIFDAALTQYTGWYSIPQAHGGLDACVAALSSQFPHFAMGRAMATALQLVSTASSPQRDPTLLAGVSHLETLLASADSSAGSDAGLTPRERLHCRAVVQLGKGNMYAACRLWEDVLVDHPTDMLALKLAHDCYFYLGRQREMRDSVARVLPAWRPSEPLYGYVLGQQAFGLLENRDYEQAAAYAKQGLDINPLDGWSSHSLAHVYEMTGRHHEGLRFMADTEHQWTFCNMLAGHNYWHTALFHIEKGQHEEALTVFDDKLKSYLSSGQLLDIIDSSSLLYRLQLEGVEVGARWQRLMGHCLPHLDDHATAFNDLHLLMACLGSGNPEYLSKATSSLAEYYEDGDSESWRISKELGQPLVDALVAFDVGDYAKAASTLLQLRYEIVRIGGSDAQRDLFSQLLVHSCIRSPQHVKYARWLLNERAALKHGSPLTDRLMARLALATLD